MTKRRLTMKQRLKTARPRLATIDLFLEVLGPQPPSKRLERREWGRQHQEFIHALDEYVDAVVTAAEEALVEAVLKAVKA